MATNRTPGSRPGLIHCDHCGEDYSSSYRRCPFCDEYDEYDNSASATRSSGGKRLDQSKRRGGGYTKTSPFRVIAYIISLAVIIAAVWIMVTKVAPLINAGNVDTIDPDTSQSGTSDPAPDSSPDPNDQPGTAQDPDVEPSPTVSVDPGNATGFTLNEDDFSFSDRYPDPITLVVTFTPAGTSSPVTWTSSDPDIASVDENGKVSHGTKRGNAIITATIPNGVTQTCTVYNQISGTSAPSPTPTPTPNTGTYTINKSDFTFYTSGEKTQLKVNGYSGGVTWTSSNTSVASVSSDGVCKAVGNGTCTITGTLDNGSTVEAIARVKIQN